MSAQLLTSPRPPSSPLALAQPGAEVLCFSYGSGLAATMFNLRVVDRVDDIAAKVALKARLDARSEVSPEDFSAVSPALPVTQRAGTGVGFGMLQSRPSRTTNEDECVALLFVRGCLLLVETTTKRSAPSHLARRRCCPARDRTASVA